MYLIAVQALHVKQRLKERAVEEGKLQHVRKSFWETHIAPLFRDTYEASSSEDSDEKERKAKEHRREIRQKKRDDRKEMLQKVEKAQQTRTGKAKSVIDNPGGLAPV